MSLKENATTAASDALDKTKSAAKDAASAAKEQIRTHAGDAKDGVADEVNSISSALRTAADDMRSGSPQERMVGQVAGTLADVSDTIRDKDLSEMVHATTRFARQNPAVFLGSAAFLGFAAARFAKSSAPAGSPGTPSHRSVYPAATQTASDHGSTSASMSNRGYGSSSNPAGERS